MLNYIPAALIILSVFVSVYVGILMNRRDVTSLREDMNRQFEYIDKQFYRIDRQFDGVNARLTLIEEDQKQFFTTTGKLEGRIEELSRR